MTWPAPTPFVWGLFALLVAGALLPLDVGQRHREHIVVTIAATTTLALLGPAGLLLVWGAAAAGLVVLGTARRATADAAVGVVSTAAAVTAGFALAFGVHVVLAGRRFPIDVSSSADAAWAWFVLGVAWIGTMAVRTAVHGLAGGVGDGHALDPFDSPLVPYLLPLVAGTPLVAASLALYRADDPWPCLAALCWSVPVYAVCRFDLHRRDVAQRLRREDEARGRLVAIGRATAATAHQARHQAGLMGWSIHRLRAAVDGLPADVAVAAHRELDTLARAKQHILRTFEEGLLHEPPAVASGHTPGDGDGAATGVEALVNGVVDQLSPKARGSGRTLEVAIADAAAGVDVPAPLHDAVFNLVDNALDAAARRVVIAADLHGGMLTITVCDDGPGLTTEIAGRAFEPFVSTKAGGIGMGLAIADAAVAEAGGELRHDRTRGTTRFSVGLPLVDRPVAG